MGTQVWPMPVHSPGAEQSCHALQVAEQVVPVTVPET
jgi:hypothetical protein